MCRGGLAQLLAMQGILGLIDLQPAQGDWELDTSKDSSLWRRADGEAMIILTYCAGHGKGAVPVVNPLAWVLPVDVTPSLLHGWSSLSVW